TVLSNVWLLDEVPHKVRHDLRLPDRDQGIDLIARTKTGGYWAIQCKYRAQAKSTLSWREIATFTALAFGVCRHIEFGLIAYPGERYAKVLEAARHSGILSSDVWSTLDDSFFDALAKRLAGKPTTIEPRSPREHQRRAIESAKSYFAEPTNTRG